jgi:1-phosphatidylinositol-4-phosphate 5-kinase
MKLDGIKSSDLLESLNLENNRNSVFKAGQGAGASGSFFFYSYDNKFLIKTLTNLEKKTLLDRLLGFVSYFKQNNN